MNLRIVLDFLKDLAENNNREWMNENKTRYLEARNAFVELVQTVLDRLTETEPELSNLLPGECIFRLYRDIRFSKDKTPFKTNFGAVIKPGGRKSPSASFYIHLEPGNSLLAGGMYKPQAEILKAIRQEIDYEAEEFRAILNDPVFRSRFGMLTGEKLKRAPKDYPPDNPNIELLKFKDYLIMTRISDTTVLKKDFTDLVVESYYILKPFNQFLNRALVE